MIALVGTLLHCNQEQTADSAAAQIPSPLGAASTPTPVEAPATATSPPGAGPAPQAENGQPATHFLDITGHAQPDGSVWCWAAVAQTMTGYVLKDNRGVPQCLQASFVKAKKEGRSPPLAEADAKFCCPDEQTPATCQVRAWPPFDAFRFSVTRRQGCLPTWKDLTTELYGDGTASRPLAFSVHFSQDGGSHIFAVTGYYVDETGTRWVDVWDSTHPGAFRLLDYDTYRKGDASFSIGYVYSDLAFGTGELSDKGMATCATE